MNKQEIEKAIETLKSIYPSQREIKTGEYDHVADAIDDTIEALEQQLNNGWIPASKPPKDSGEYFATVKWNFGSLETEKVVYAKDINQWIWDFGGSDKFVDVIAWMPMPEPYKGD